VNSPSDPDEAALQEVERRADPRRVGDALERIEWRLQYGEFGAPGSLKLIGWIIIVLLCLILWRLW
jgi:hypothetical protein